MNLFSRVYLNQRNTQVFYALEKDLNRTPFEMKTSARKNMYI